MASFLIGILYPSLFKCRMQLKMIPFQAMIHLTKCRWTIQRCLKTENFRQNDSAEHFLMIQYGPGLRDGVIKMRCSLLYVCVKSSCPALYSRITPPAMECLITAASYIIIGAEACRQISDLGENVLWPIRYWRMNS